MKKFTGKRLQSPRTKRIIGVALFAACCGVVGAILLLRSSANPSVSNAFEPEDGALSNGVTAITDATASGGKGIAFPVPATTCPAGQVGTPPNCVTPPASSTIQHGADLALSDVGPWALQGVAKGQEKLQDLTTDERVSLASGWGRPSWVPNKNYVYNNDPTNHGGIVPPGGMTIDGYFVPAGTWVAQFYNFKSGVVVEGNVNGQFGSWPGILFRGNRMRGLWSAPGWMNENSVSNGGIVWITYSDAGGISTMRPSITESIFESQGRGSDKMYLIRNYLSIATTLAFLRGSGDAAIENYGETVIPYYNDTTYHMNGIANGGAETATLWLRNHLDFSPQPSDSPYFMPQNDVIQMAADNGAYPGTGTNLDGSVGYQIRDNYLAGAAHTLQLGVDKNNSQSQVRNVVVTGNKFSTRWFSDSGSSGISYKNPLWGSYGNTWSNNLWADDYGSGSGLSGRQYPSGNGPRAGKAITAPTAL